MNRRDLFKFLAGIGLGAVAIETYERLHHIPMLETMFRKELEYWINQYNIAREEVERLTGKLREREGEISSLRGELARSKEELEHLIQQYNTTKEEVSRLSEVLRQSEEEINNLKEKVGYWEAQYNTAREEVGRLNSIINKIDELERESTSAIAYYRGRMDEAIRKLREVIERYRVLLGDERVSFEYSTLKILEDLRLTEERLQKVLPYFPLILNLYWRPMRVVNDKIYDINVVFEVISPLSSLEDVEVTLRPIEYKYFITKYGMREEDYNKVFPEEDVRIVRIKPLQTERKIFSVDFKDLKGGREYFIEVRVRDVAGNEKRVAVKTPYIRQFENIAKTDDILVGAVYYPWYPHNWQFGSTYTPLLGKHDTTDPIVVNKHIDWATGHGIDFFAVSWPGLRSWLSKRPHMIENLENGLLKSSLIDQIKFVIFFEPSYLEEELPNVNKREAYFKDIKYIISNYFKNSSYLKINEKPVIIHYNVRLLYKISDNPSDIIGQVREISNNSGYNLRYIGEVFLPSIPGMAPWLPPREELLEKLDGLTNWIVFRPWENNVGGEKSWEEFLSDINIYYPEWKKYAQRYNIWFIPLTAPGFDDRYCSWGSKTVLPKDMDKFKKFLDISLLNMQGSKLMLIATWNDWCEGTNIEPSIETGFKELIVIKDTLSNYKLKS